MVGTMRDWFIANRAFLCHLVFMSNAMIVVRPSSACLVADMAAVQLVRIPFRPTPSDLASLLANTS